MPEPRPQTGMQRFIVLILMSMGFVVLFGIAVFGKDRVKELANLVPADARVLITYGGGSAKKSGLIDRSREALGNRAAARARSASSL